MIQFVFLIAIVSQLPEGLPTIEEHFNQVIYLDIEGEQYDRILFVRHNRVIAKRMALENMTWSITQNGFLLEWEDYSIAHRVIRFDEFVLIPCESDPTNEDGPWWCMNRNMGDLKQP